MAFLLIGLTGLVFAGMWVHEQLTSKTMPMNNYEDIIREMNKVENTTKDMARAYKKAVRYYNEEEK